MIWPLLIIIRLGRWFWLPVPVILLWPFMIALMILTAPLFVFSGDTHAGTLVRVIWRMSGLFAAMNGTRVRVDPTDGPRITVIVI